MNSRSNWFKTAAAGLLASSRLSWRRPAASSGEITTNGPRPTPGSPGGPDLASPGAERRDVGFRCPPARVAGSHQRIPQHQRRRARQEHCRQAGEGARRLCRDRTHPDGAAGRYEVPVPRPQGRRPGSAAARDHRAFAGRDGRSRRRPAPIVGTRLTPGYSGPQAIQSLESGGGGSSSFGGFFIGGGRF